MTDAVATVETPPPAKRGKAWPWALWSLGVVAGLLILLIMAGVVVRYGSNTGPGRSAIVQLVNGMKIGPLGRLRLTGLHGDVFGAFSLDRVEIVDAKGAWTRAEGVSLIWDPGELLARRVHFGRIWATDLRIFRQPILTKEPPQPLSNPPVSVVLDDIRLRFETHPEFSVQRGLWQVHSKFILRRSGAAKAHVDARSLLHAGDGLVLDYDLGRKDHMHLKADGQEAAGGALAGALGLPADRRLVVHAIGDADTTTGQLVAKVMSGAADPLDFTAHWSKAGADVTGRADLAASHLTRFLADRLGPEAKVNLSIKPDHGDLFRAIGTLVARDGQIAVDGPVDWRKRRAENLGVELSVTDLSKWLTIPKIGPARIQGGLTGVWDDWVLKGRATGDRLEQNGYKVAHLAGPASFTRANHEWRVEGDFQGSGGAGATPIGPLLGPSPRAIIDVNVLKDGRFLIRSLDLKGSGAQVQAEGGQGLFGDLSFKGKLSISNLSPIHQGAHGAVSASWDASEVKGSHIWALSLDAKGANFATGLAELDRYLGNQPHLTGKGGWADGRLTFDRAELAGGALQVSGKGAFGPNEAVAFEGDWTARGPFAAGPVEVAGLAKGTGRVSGTWSSPRADLVAELASVDFGRLVVTPAKLALTLLKGPDGLDGVGALEGPTAKYGHASLKTGFRLIGSGIELNDLVADAGGVNLSGALSLKNGAPSTANLTVSAAPGAFLTAGRLSGSLKLVDGPGGTQAALDLTGQGVAAPELPLVFRAARIHAAGPLARLPFQASLDGVDPLVWTFKGDGIYAGGKETVVTLTGGGKIRKANYTTQSPAEFRFGPEGNGVKLHLAIAGGRADVEARLAAGATDAKAQLQNVSLAALTDDFIGTASGTLSLQGKGPRLDGTLDAVLDGARSRDAPANEALKAVVKATLAGPRLHLLANASNPEGLKSNLDVDLPAEASADPFRIAINRIKPLSGTFDAEGEIRPLWDLLAGGERTLSGQVSAHATLGGTIADPAATGQATLSKGRFKDVWTGLELHDISGASTFNHTLVNISRFSGVDPKGGTLSGDGKVSLDRGGASTFVLNAKRFQLIDNEIGRAQASGAVTLTREADGKIHLGGALAIDHAEFAANTPVPTGVVPMDVVELHVPQKEGVEKPAPRGHDPVLTLDVNLSAARGIFLRGRGLDAELSLDAHVGGSLSLPELTGIARIVRGSYDFAGQRFEFDSSGTVRLASTADQIRLDLTATRDDPTLTAVVRVRGTAARPDVTISSTPVLPQEEVLARVLFGVSASQLSPAQGAQLVSALASLRGGGGFDLIGNLRQFAGLDRLALGGTQASGTTVSGGKYLTDNVYLELTGGGRTGPSAQVEWRVRRNLSLVSVVGAQGDARLSIRFRKDY